MPWKKEMKLLFDNTRMPIKNLEVIPPKEQNPLTYETYTRFVFQVTSFRMGLAWYEI